MISSLYKILSDDTRLRIVRLLRSGSFTVSEVETVTGGRQSTVSHHLKVLSGGGFVRSIREGSLIYYRLDNENDGIYFDIYNYIDRYSDMIPYRIEDQKRTELIYSKRRELAESYFNNPDNLSHLEYLDSIYSIEELSPFIGKYGTIAEIGCGNGRNLPYLSGYAQKVIGIDVSPKMIQMAEHICRKNNLNYELVTSSIDEAGSRGIKADAVLLNMALHHFPHPEQAFGIAASMLNENGELFVIEFCKRDEIDISRRNSDLWTGFPVEEIESWVSGNGLIVDKMIIKELDKESIVIVKALNNGNKSA